MVRERAFSMQGQRGLGLWARWEREARVGMREFAGGIFYGKRFLTFSFRTAKYAMCCVAETEFRGSAPRFWRRIDDAGGGTARWLGTASGRWRIDNVRPFEFDSCGTSARPAAAP
jgi:hypothetical protein